MSDHRHQMVSGADSPCNAGPYGDTTYTKIFVGGLAWETTRETLRRYFEQFGEIVAAVVITDKYTRRSKGYGFLMFGSCLHETFSKVTFEDPESAARACQNPSPVIDGRRTNCNIAAFGLPQPHAPKNGLNLSAAGKEGLLGPIPSQATQSDHRPLSMHSGPPPPPEIYRMNRHAVCYNWQQVPMYYIPGAPGYPRIYYSYYPFYAPFRQPCDSSTLQGFRMQYPQSMRYPYLPQQYCIMGILPFPASSSEAGSTNGSISTQCSIQTYYQN